MVDSELFEQYQAALGVNADLVKQCVENLVKQHSGNLTKKELREIYVALVQKFGTISAQVALEFYEKVREQAEVEDDYQPIAFIPDNAGLLAWDAATATQNQLAGMAVQRVMQYADETIYGNGAADPAKPKFAIVPHPGACGWCLMVGGWGWNYNTRTTANSQRHPNCKCTVVAEFDTRNPKLKGYDNVVYQDLWAAAQNRVDENELYREWSAMTPEQQRKYKRRYHRNKLGAESVATSQFDVFKRNRIISELTNHKDEIKRGIRLDELI